MLRSRDLLIFAVVVILLVLGIGLTLFLQTSANPFTSSNTFFVSKTATTTFTASTESADVDREGTIARLRKLLSLSDVANMPSPSVEETTSVVATSTQGGEGTESPLTIMRCDLADDALVASQSWPLQDVSLSVQNGTRIVTHTAIVQDVVQESVSTSTATSSERTVTAKSVRTTLLRMPQFPPVLPKPSCVPSDVIGVTQSGFLIFNQDAVSYKGRGQEDLLGYARDGFPIYGVYDGEVDSCGGYTKDGSYRYSLAKDRNFILGCFAGLPLPFEGIAQ
jgi:hypothetical protein